MTAGYATGIVGQQLLDRVEHLQAVAAAQERDMQWLVGVLAERRERDQDPWDVDCDEVDQAPLMITINPGRYL